MIEQRTDEWYLQRKGKVTASECYLLLGTGRYRQRTFTKQACSYLDGKIAERLTPDEQFLNGVYEQPITNAMQWGIDNEVNARMRYLREMKDNGTPVKFTEAGFVELKEMSGYAGGSPDGYVDGGIIEIKCPTRGKHLTYFEYPSADFLAEENPQYYAQMQMNMLCVRHAGERMCKFCDFISYNPTMYKEVQIRIIRVPYNASFCEILLTRLALARLYIASSEIDKRHINKKVITLL